MTDTPDLTPARLRAWAEQRNDDARYHEGQGAFQVMKQCEADADALFCAADRLATLAARVIELEAENERIRKALQNLVTLITASASEEETSTHVAVSFCEADAANILRSALRARAALEDRT